MHSFYIICQCLPSDESPFYWNTERGWIDEFEKATRFNRNILTLPPPRGATSIIELNEVGRPLSLVKIIPPPEGDLKNS